MDLLNYIASIFFLVTIIILIVLLYPHYINHGTTLSLRKTKRDDHSFFHTITFHYRTINPAEAEEILRDVSILVSRMTKKYTVYLPSQVEKERERIIKKENPVAGKIEKAITFFDKQK